MDERQQDELGGVIIVSTCSRHRRIRRVSRMGEGSGGDAREL